MYDFLTGPALMLTFIIFLGGMIVRVVYLFGLRYVMLYRYVYCVFILIGAVWAKDLVWKFVDAAIVLMAVPNLIALIILAPVVKQMTCDYFKQDHKPTVR